MSEDAAAALTTLWEQRGLSASSVALRDDGTLAASERTALAESKTAIAALDPGDETTLSLSPEGLAVGDVLGRGGMGEVRLATQKSLRREVAVKTVLDPDSPAAISAVLKEAWVGAALEHPNVIPVHTLAGTPRGPAVVMKRVEGVSLTAVLRDPTKYPRFAADPLEASLRVLASVCRAIELAHERGILHLDLKPDNVMIGRFGEVYVLDWGLAAAMGSGPEWLARASDITAIAGTPAYMAPELVAADASRIDARTDVYLLGGVLHTIVTGEPLHRGHNLMQTLVAAWTSKPKSYGEDVPPALAEIVARATAKEQDDRFPSARAFREALEAFLRHRRADALVRRAIHGLAELGPLLEERASEAEIEPRLAECEVAIEQARRGWAAHPQLDAAHEQLLARRTEQALLRERPDAAAAFLAQMREPPVELRARLDALRRRLRESEARLVRLEAMSRELDLTLGSAPRRRLFGSLGAMWLAISLLLGWLTRSGALTIGYRELLVEGGLLVLSLGPFAYWKRRVFLHNTANQRLYGGLALTAGAVELHWIACAALELPVATALAITPIYYVYAFTTLALALDRRFFLAVAPMVLCGIGTALLPERSLDLIGVGGGAAVALILWAWRRA